MCVRIWRELRYGKRKLENDFYIYLVENDLTSFLQTTYISSTKHWDKTIKIGIGSTKKIIFGLLNLFKEYILLVISGYLKISIIYL